MASQVHFSPFIKVCEWEIEANPNDRIQLYDFDIDLQFAPDYANCNQYDYLEINQIQDEQINLATICRNDFYNEIISTGNKISIKFVSNFVKNAAGIRFSVRTWGNNIF